VSGRSGAATGAAGVVFGLVVGVVTLLVPVVGGVDSPGFGSATTGLVVAAIPAAYVPLLQRAATTCPPVTAALLAGQISVESSWNPAAVSPAGAQGIAQFTPDTWARAGVDGDGDGVRDPFDPADAIPAQAAQMCRLLAAVTAARLPGDPVDLALAAYNAGPQRVLDARGIPSIPETQAYVRTVRTAAAAYAGGNTSGTAGTASGTVAPASGAPLDGTWEAPVDGPLTSGFGPREDGFHPGADLGVPIGTPVRAAHDGSVIAAGPAEGFGQWVVLDHGGGVHTVYGHISQVLVSVGQAVRAGDVIAQSGNEGTSSGPHLHFEVRLDGQAVDPVAYYQALGLAL